MEPALHDGDLVLARRLGGDLPHRGDIVVLRRPRAVAPPPGSVVVHSAAPAVAGSPWLVKRVAAVPGDPAPPGVPCPDPVPAGMVVVLGDTPGLDSTLFGPVPAETLHATVVRTLDTAR
ncbi:S26 family signal peptidase [Dactylosporangium sp. NBC_01737]|nr:S26 family signal peptidase [Dactylosporangium sp. NBC_01737]